MDDSLRGSEFARVLQASRSHTPRRHHLPPPALPSIHLAGTGPPPAQFLLSAKHHLPLGSPPMSPVSGSSPLPALQSMDVPRLSNPSYLAAQPTPLQPDPNAVVQPPPSSISAGCSSLPSGPSPLRLPFRLSPSAAVLESQPTSPITPQPAPASVSSTEQQHRPCRPHPVVSVMANLSEPHPLNILADISSAASKSPVKWDQTPSSATLLPVQRTILKTNHGKSPLAGSAAAAAAAAMSLPSAGSVLPSDAGPQSPVKVPKLHGVGIRAAQASFAGQQPVLSSPQAKPSIRCSQCPSTFTERFNLNKHIRAVHERRRPFQCSTCNARFQQRDHMQKHEMCVHKKLRQFSCDVCGASFGWRGVLKKHRKSVHGIHE